MSEFDPTLEMTSYRSFLWEQWQDRRKKNPAISLRAFSAKLGISPATFSQILSGKRRLTEKTALNIADRLNLNPRQRQSLVRLAQPPGGKTPDVAPEGEYETLQLEVFQVISDWYHYAILSLLEVEDGNKSTDSIANRLGILKREAEGALDRMTKLGLVEKQSNRKYIPTSKPLATPDDLKDSGIRRHLIQHLGKAEEAIEQFDSEDTDFSSLTMAIDPEKIPWAKRKLKNFRRTLCRGLESGKRKKVYALSIQFYPLEKDL